MREDKQIKEDDLISIVMPVRNGELYLKECIDSILNQSYSNWELVAINDHSTDQTSSILEEYAKQDNRIRWQDNSGVGIISALQQAYVATSGSFITRMDADDRMTPEKLASLHKALQGRGSNAVATAKVEYFSEEGVGDGYRKYQNWLNDLVDREAHFKEIYKECVVPSPCWMIHRILFERCGAFRSDRYPEDYDLVFRWYQNELEIVGVDETLHYWRDHSDRASRNDPNYIDNCFLELKVHYFLEIDYDKNKPLVLLGAGKKAKKIAELLLSRKVKFEWRCNNPNKIGRDIYGVVLQSSEEWSPVSQVIGAIAGSEQEDYRNHSDIYWFC